MPVIGCSYSDDPFYRIKIKTEEKANVVASLWGEEFIPFLAVLL